MPLPGGCFHREYEPVVLWQIMKSDGIFDA